MRITLFLILFNLFSFGVYSQKFTWNPNPKVLKIGTGMIGGQTNLDGTQYGYDNYIKKEYGYIDIEYSLRVVRDFYVGGYVRLGGIYNSYYHNSEMGYEYVEKRISCSSCFNLSPVGYPVELSEATQSELNSSDAGVESKLESGDFGLRIFLRPDSELNKSVHWYVGGEIFVSAQELNSAQKMIYTDPISGIQVEEYFDQWYDYLAVGYTCFGGVDYSVSNVLMFFGEVGFRDLIGGPADYKINKQKLLYHTRIGIGFQLGKIK